METTEVQVVQHGNASLSLRQITDRVNIVHQVLDKVMKKGTHYGTVPGCGAKMVLLKPGADVLAMTFRLVPQFKVEKMDMENGHREYDVTCTMYGPDGSMLGQGVGSGSTMEKKYRYRWEGEGARRAKIENEDIADTYNTVLKMAKKRAQIDATLTVTGAADMFTQDLIEDEDEPKRAPVAMPQEIKQDAAPKAPDAGELVISGILEKVSVKAGGTEKKPWTKYGLLIQGEWYGTFDTTMGEGARALEGKPVDVAYTSDGKYKTAVNLRMSGAATPAQPSDDLPFN